MPTSGSKVVGGEALALLSQSGFTMAGYRSARKKKDVLKWFDAAIMLFDEQRRRKAKQDRRDRQLRVDEEEVESVL